MNTEQERAAFEAWYQQHHGRRDMYERDASGEYADKQVQGAFNVWQARATLQSQPQETIAYVTRNEEGDRALLFFDLKEARLYCSPDEEPEALVLAGPTLQSQDWEDAERYRWLRSFNSGDVRVVDITTNTSLFMHTADAAIDHARRIKGDS